MQKYRVTTYSKGIGFYIDSLFFYVFTTKTLKITAFTFCMSNRQFSILDNLKKTEGNVTKFYFEGFLLNTVDTFLFWLRLYKNDGHFAYRLKVF